jgi:hypothetical protein
MKAYMSDRNGRGYVSLWYSLEKAAIAEAERILADAEPGMEYGDCFDVSDLSHNERAALAEGFAFAITALEEISDAE